MDGFIYLHRKLLENPICQKPEYFTVWITLLLKASYTENEVIWNGSLLKLKPGQFITGRKKLSKELHINEYKIERILKYLENAQQITQQTFTKFRIISIVNWSKYQLKDKKYTPKCTTTAQQLHTINKDNKEKKEYIEHYLLRIKDLKGENYKVQISKRVYQMIDELLDEFKPPEIIDMIDYYFDKNNKGEKCGYDLTTILNANSVNQWQDYAK